MDAVELLPCRVISKGRDTVITAAKRTQKMKSHFRPSKITAQHSWVSCFLQRRTAEQQDIEPGFVTIKLDLFREAMPATNSPEANHVVRTLFQRMSVSNMQSEVITAYVDFSTASNS